MSNDLWIVDLFCGAGGATRGYQRAGFRVVGVDLKPQRHYCGDLFIWGSAPELLQAAIRTIEAGGPGRQGRVVAVHASPPCQGYSRMNHVHKREYPLLVEPVRAALQASGLPYVIENVVGAPLINPVTLCGTIFGLGVLRHRNFETSFAVLQPECGSHIGEFYEPAGHGAPNRNKRSRNPHLKGVGYTERCRQAMGIDWMNRDELGEAIPPAYTEFIGKQLMEHIHVSC